MKKEEILFVRVMSVAAILAAMALIMIFGPGSTLFKGIVDNINNNLVDINSSDGSIYNLYFYKGLGTVYTVVLSVAIFTTCMAVASIFTRFRGAGVFSLLSAYSMILTGIYIVISYVLQNSIAAHKLIAGFYIDSIANDFETAHLIGAGNLVCAVITIILGILALLLIKSSRINKIDTYFTAGKERLYMSVVPVVFASVYFEWIRGVIFNGFSEHDTLMYTANSFITDYYFAGKWFHNIPLVWFFCIPILIAVVFRNKINAIFRRKSKQILFVSLIPAMVIFVRSVIYYITPPLLFGYLTIDERVCDIVDGTFVPYMIMFLTDAMLITMMIYMLIAGLVANKKILITIVVNIIISILLITVIYFIHPGTATLCLMYCSCIAANVISIIWLMLNGFKSADVG